MTPRDPSQGLGSPQALNGQHISADRRWSGRSRAKPVCVKRLVLGARVRRGAGGRSVGFGPGSGLSEVPVFRV
jgi:hypothetical protein